MESRLISDTKDAEINAVLLRIYTLIGLRPEAYPSKMANDMNVQYIKAAYGHYRILELLSAYELAIFGKIDADVNPYDQFSIAYLAKIMDAYRKHKNQTIIAGVKEKEPELLPPSKVTREEMERELAEYKKNESIKVQFIPLYLYDYMQELGYNVEVNQDFLWKACMVRKNQLYLRAESDPSNRNEYADFCTMLEAGEIKGAEKLIVTNLAKKIIVYKKLYDQKNGQESR